MSVMRSACLNHGRAGAISGVETIAKRRERSGCDACLAPPKIASSSDRIELWRPTADFDIMLHKLLSTPLLSPLKFVEWVGGTIDGSVQAQMNEAEVMKQELTRLERQLDRGELSEDEFDALERSIVRRLQAAARRMAAIGPGSSQARSPDGEIG